MHLRKTSWIAITGLMWLVIGISLLTKGLQLIVQVSQGFLFEKGSLVARLAPLSGGREKAGLVLITIGLLIGFIKGRYVFVKTIRRVVARILQLPVPFKISQVYSRQYLLLIGGMMCLGIALKWIPIPQEIRGVVDVAIGSALINGAFIYFRLSLAVHKQSSSG